VAKGDWRTPEVLEFDGAGEPFEQGLAGAWDQWGDDERESSTMLASRAWRMIWAR
jgi:hypothetical protein